MSAPFQDGSFSTIQSTGPVKILYPLQEEGDYSTQAIEQDYTVIASNIPSPSGIGSNTHPSNSNAYLMAQSSPSIQYGVAQVTRTFCEVPTGTNVGSSTAVVLPDIPVEAPNTWGNFIVLQPDSTIEKYDIYAKTDVLTDSGPATQFNVTGGSYALTYKNVTTNAIAYNANASTVNTEFNALSSVSAANGVTTSGTYTDGFTISFNDLHGITGDNTYFTNGKITVTSATGTLSRYQTVTAGPAANFTPSGSFTLSFNGGTTSNIAYKSNAVTFKNALNSLPEIQAVGNVDVSLSISIQNYNYTVSFLENETIEVDNTLLLPSGSYGEVDVSGAYFTTQQIYLIGTDAIRTLYAPSHGISSADNVVVKYGDANFATPQTFTVSTPDTIQLTGLPSDIWMATANIYQIGHRTVQNYTAGPVTSVATTQTDYYLPGVTPNISTYADIPVPEEESTDVEVMEKVFSGSGNLVYRVDALSRWNGWPIYRQAQTIINVTNLI